MNQVDFEKILHDNGMPVTEDEVRKEFDEIVRSENLITNTSKMSPFWRLITAIVIKPYIHLKDALINSVMVNMFLMTAEDWALEMWGAGVNLDRKENSAVTGMIKFVKNNADQVVNIKAGTVIQSPPINGHVYELKTLDDVIIPSGIVSSRVPVIAAEAGAAYNLAAGYYRILVEEIPGIDSVVNDDDWITSPGADKESPHDYKERIRNQYNLVGHYHTDAVYRGIIATITGIATNQVYFVHDAPRGPGTANAYILLDEGVATIDFIKAINDFIMIEGHHGHGDDLQCFAIPERKYSVTAILYFKAEQLPSDIDNYVANIENFIRCAFRQNQDYNLTKVNAYSRFSISNLDRELHEKFKELHSISFNIDDIVSELEVPRLESLNVTHKIAEQGA